MYRSRGSRRKGVNQVSFFPVDIGSIHCNHEASLAMFSKRKNLLVVDTKEALFSV